MPRMHLRACLSPAPTSHPPPPPTAVLPSGTPRGGPQLPNLAGGSAAGSGGHKGGKAEGQDKPGRRPLGDVTHHYAAASKGIYIGALGGAFGMVEGVPAASCRQEAAAAAEAQAAAARARAAAAKRQALRSMR